MKIAQIKQDFERRLAEKEEQMDNQRRNQQRSIESMKTTLDFESKTWQEAMRIKKKVEGDINALEIQLDKLLRRKSKLNLCKLLSRIEKFK